MQLRHRLRVVAVATGLTLAAVGFGAPAPLVSAAETGPVTSVLVTGQCTGGGGRVAFSAQRLDLDHYRVTARAAGLDDGSVWRGELATFSESPSGQDTYRDSSSFRVVAIDGRWTVTALVRTGPGPLFLVSAFERGHRNHSCWAFSKPNRPLLGVSGCHRGAFAGVLARHREGVGTVVRWASGSVRPGSIWHVTVTAAEDADRLPATRVERVTAGRGGFLHGKFVFPHKTDPSVRLSLLSDGGQRCAVGAWHGRAVSARAATGTPYDGPLPESPLVGDPAARAVVSALDPAAG